ncbi:MAG: hypothetical protein ACP6IP_05530 [Candidatus Njordarchaeia archaeon]
MPASHIEKLIWNYIKNYILGGFFIFFKKETIALTLYLIAQGLLLHYGYTTFPLVFVLSLSLIILGVAIGNRKLSPKASAVLAVILLVLNGLAMVYQKNLTGLLTVSSSYQGYVIIALLLFWIVFSTSYFIIQMAEFFASTAGLYLLWGSDRRWIFLTPIPHIIIASIFAISIYDYYIYGNVIESTLIFLPAIIIILLLAVFRNVGRVVRNSFALYSIFPLYYAAATVFKGSMLQGAVINGVLTFIGILFMMQSRVRTVAVKGEGKKAVITYMILVVYGTIMILMGFLVNKSLGSGNSIMDYWWHLNLISVISSLILVSLYMKLSGKLKYYERRDKLQSKDLVLELVSIIGKKMIEELSKSYLSMIEGITKKVIEKKDESVEGIKKTVKDLFDKFFKGK